MLHPRTDIMRAMNESREAFFDTLAARLAAHERHARVTSSEPAYHAAMKMARTMRAAIVHLQADDVDAVCSDLSAWLMVSESAESALRMARFKQSV